MQPPKTEEELLGRARQLAGRRLAEIAAELGIPVPPDMRRHKGWIGQLMERALGATAGNKDEPDFEQLGVELKTLPIDRTGKPLETTFVATIPLNEVGQTAWEDSRVRRKLARVLWVPVLAERAIAPAERVVASAMLWSPSSEQEAALRFDWEQLAGMIGCGDIERIDGTLGEVMQVRPKAAHGGVRRRIIDAEGDMNITLPRGFYLRTSFTRAILKKAFMLA
ncbi:MAG: DNA mismatch repair endonuclease MutH [Polyangiaceae bacterium]